MNAKYSRSRPSIPIEIRRLIAIESGHMCAIKHCYEHTYNEYHHIDGNRENNVKENLIYLCDKHHKMTHSGVIDRKSLREYKLINDNNLKGNYENEKLSDIDNKIKKILTYLEKKINIENNLSNLDKSINNLIDLSFDKLFMCKALFINSKEENTIEWIDYVSISNEIFISILSTLHTEEDLVKNTSLLKISVNMLQAIDGIAYNLLSNEHADQYFQRVFDASKRGMPDLSDEISTEENRENLELIKHALAIKEKCVDDIMAIYKNQFSHAVTIILSNITGLYKSCCSLHDKLLLSMILEKQELCVNVIFNNNFLRYKYNIHSTTIDFVISNSSKKIAIFIRNNKHFSPEMNILKTDGWNVYIINSSSNFIQQAEECLGELCLAT